MAATPPTCRSPTASVPTACRASASGPMRRRPSERQAFGPARRRGLFRARDPGLLDDLAPARDLVFHESLELVGRRRELRNRAVADQVLLDVRIVHDGADLGVEPGDDLLPGLALGR